MIQLITFLIIFCAIFSFAPQTFAQDCKPLYGGGVTKEQACDGKKVATPTPQKAKATSIPTPTKQKAGTTSKGGLPVISPTPQKSTPSTGPEVLGLLGLIPAAIFGVYLRKRS